MEDIVFPPWVRYTATLALSFSLSKSLRSQFHGKDRQSAEEKSAVDEETLQKQRLHATVRGEVEADEARRAEEEKSQTDSSSDDDDEDGEEDLTVVLRQARRPSQGHSVETSYHVSTAAAVRLLFGKEARDQTEGERRLSLAKSLGKNNKSTDGSTDGNENKGGASTGNDILYHPKVVQLLQGSNMERLSSTAGATLTHKDAVGIVSLMAFAVGVQEISSLLTQGFYTEVSTLFVNFFQNVKQIQFATGVEVTSFMATLTACALKLRRRMSPPAEVSPGNSRPQTPRQRDPNSHEEYTAGFDPTLIDPLLLDHIPSDIDVCVKDPIGIGVLEGLALTYQRTPVHLGAALVEHLHDLADAFATSSHRREVAYKRLLCILLEGLSCSRVIDYQRANGWISAIIQADYVRKGLFQRELLHARVVSATLVLLVRQYQELAREYVRKEEEEGKSVPDFTEGDQLIEIVWEALQTTTALWTSTEVSQEGGMITASPSPQNTTTEANAADGGGAGESPSKHSKLSHLYGQNLKTVVFNLLRTEVERLRCYYVMTGRRQIRSSEENKDDGEGETAYYFPSDEEESLRIQMATNIIKFLLQPTSVMNLIPLGQADPDALRASITEYCVQVLSVASSSRFLNHPEIDEESSSRVQKGKESTFTEAPLAVFSNRYYHRMEQILHELIETVVHRSDVALVHPEKATTHNESGGNHPNHYNNTTTTNHNDTTAKNEKVKKDNSKEKVSAETVAKERKKKLLLSLDDAITALCIENLSIADPHLVSFASSEVMDNVVQLTSKGGAGQGKRPTTPEAKNNNNNNKGPQQGKKDAESVIHNANTGSHNTDRLSVCLNILSEIVVPQRYSILNLVGLTDLARFGQLLSDNYQDSLREMLLTSTGDTLSDVFRKREIPSSTMNVAADGFYKLIIRVHERIISIAKDALGYFPDDDSTRPATVEELKKERHRYVRVLNREGESIRLLTKTLLKCMLDMCFPGSGILYQKKSGGTRPADSNTSPSAMADLAKACISPLLPSLCLLFQLSTLFPIRHVRPLKKHVEYGSQLLSAHLSDPHIVHYYFQPSKLRFHYEKEETANLFRSFWFMISFYGFAKEALHISSLRIKTETVKNASAGGADPSNGNGKAEGGNQGVVIQGVSTMLTEREAKLFRWLATSAPPLLRMCSSEMHQSLAEIAVLLRYIDVFAEPTSRSGIYHRSAFVNLSTLFKEAVAQFQGTRFQERSASHSTKRLKKMNNGELYLIQALTELELLRASSGSIANLTVYSHFEIREFVASPQMKYVLLDVVSVVCSQYMSSLRSLPPGLAPRLVAKDIKQLLLMFSFSIDSVRCAARLILEMVIESFPAYSTYAGRLPLLWNVINLVDGGTDSDLERLCKQLHYQETPAISPDRDSIERQIHLKDMIEVAELWAEKAQQSAPVELFSLATRFILHQEMSNSGAWSGTPLAGSRLAALAAQPTLQHVGADTSRGVHALMYPCSPSYAGALVKLSSAQGQILSALRLEAFHDVETRVLKRLVQALREGRSTATLRIANQFRLHLTQMWKAVEGGGDLLEGSAAPSKEGDRAKDTISPMRLFEFESCLGAAVALLGTNLVGPSMSARLLRYVVQSPLILFHKDYIHSAIQCWRWLLSPDRERYSLVILQQVIEGIEFTIAHRIGLFDGLHPSQSDQVQTGDFQGAETIEGTYPTDYDAVSPHSLIVAFLAEEFVSPGSATSQDTTQLRYLYELATRMVSVPEQWSLKDSSFAETMRTCSFLLHVCRAVQMNNSRRLRAGLSLAVPYTSLGVLRQRLYKCLLRWFRQDPPRWYFARQPTLALEQVNMLNELVNTLRDEQLGVRRSTLGYVDIFYPSSHRTPDSIASQKKEQTRLSDLLSLLRTLVEHELLRIRVWLNPRRTLEIPAMTTVSSWETHLRSAAEHDPAVMVALVNRFSAQKKVRETATEIILQTPSTFAHLPAAVDLYLTEDILARGAPQLYLFTNCSIIQALRLLDVRYVKYPIIPRYAIRSLLSQKSEYLIFYLPQLLQVLATDASGDIDNFLYRMSHKSTMFCHQLLWALQTEGEGSGELARKCTHLADRIVARLTSEEKTFYETEFAFTNLVTSLSGELMQFDKPQRKPNLRKRLQDEAFHTAPAQSHVYLPTDVGYRIVDVIPQTAGAMQSAAKCPILVQFKCVPRDHEDRRLPSEMTEEEQQLAASASLVKGCIFKMGDDCRQDQLSLQLMELFKRVLDSVGVPSYLYPYRVVTTGQESGIIECVPNAQSRNEIGKLVETNLAEFFVQTFGHPESVSFKRARQCFVESTAAYSIVSFILNIKDRHNGNIMLDHKGNLVHIDFGFLFDTSPGGDMNFESSPFKLTTEMVQLIGKDVGSDSKLLHSSKALSKALIDEDNYIYFKVLVNRIYLAVRQYGREICVLVELMLRSGLPCFKPKQTIQHLAKRLALDKDEVTAADYMRRRIHEARQNYRTVLYDHYQRIAEGIAM